MILTVSVTAAVAAKTARPEGNFDTTVYTCSVVKLQTCTPVALALVYFNFYNSVDC